MVIRSMTRRDMAELVSEQLPGFTLRWDGKVVEADICPLCDAVLDGRVPTHTLRVDGKRVKVCRVCRKEGVKR